MNYIRIYLGYKHYMMIRRHLYYYHEIDVRNNGWEWSKWMEYADNDETMSILFTGMLLSILLLF